MKSLFTSSKKYVIIESPSKKLVYGTKRAARGDIMGKKEMIAMLLAGGQGSRLGVLTQKVAKPAVSFGGKYRIIDFPLSNCINSGVDTVGVLTQYQPLRLNAHIGIGIPWDLDRNVGGVTVLPPYERSKGSDWYTGTANAIYQNLEYMESYNPEYVLILSGDHIYKMDYEVMLEYHKANNADVTIAAMPVPIEEASRFGILITDDNNRITEFEEKPKNVFLSRSVKGYSNSLEENMARMEFEYIREKAKEGESFVIVGRCSEDVLKDYEGLVSIFVKGDIEAKTARIMKRLNMNEEDALDEIKKQDKNRRRYHNQYSEHKWGDSRYYDMCINSSRLGLEKTARLIEKYISGEL